MALRQGLADGTIDIVATDHAPHPGESKECEWQEAAFGMLGLEHALSIVSQTMVETGLLDWAGVQDRMSTAPAKIAGYSEHGRELAVGAPAHLTVINPKAPYRVDRDSLASKSRNTPFHGMEFTAQVVATLFHGRFVFGKDRFQ
jgi:dihydroorotase